jgi:hypothetical protein
VDHARRRDFRHGLTDALISIFLLLHLSLSIGPIYGSSSKWNGLGLFFDTHESVNNFNKVFPAVYLIENHGQEYDPINGPLGPMARAIHSYKFRSKNYPKDIDVHYVVRHLNRYDEALFVSSPLLFLFHFFCMYFLRDLID